MLGSPGLNSNKYAFYMVKRKPKPSLHLKQAGPVDGCSTDRAEHYPAPDEVYGSQTSSSHCMERICNKVLNMITLSYVTLCHKHYGALKRGAMYI